MKRFCFVTVFLIFILSCLGAEILTSYVQDNPIIWSTEEDTGNYMLDYYAHTHIGTLTMIVPRTDTAYRVFISGLQYKYATVSGERNGSTTSQLLFLYYILKIDGVVNQSGYIQKSYYDSATQLLSSKTSLSGKTVTVDFYLSYYKDSQYFDPGQILEINTDLGIANIGVTKRPNGKPSDSSSVTLPINNGGGSGTDDNDYELIGGGSTTDSIDSSYDVNLLVNAVVTLTDILTNVDLSEIATGNTATRIANLNLTITGSKNNYDLSLVFSDAGSSNGFTLRNGSISIPFNLYLGSDLITKDEAYLGWTNVKKNKLQTKEIKVSGITDEIAASVPNGDYSDIISIELTIL